MTTWLSRAGRLFLTLALILTQIGPLAGPAWAQVPPQNPSQFDVIGLIQAATLDPACATDARCGGTITVNNQVITVPKNTILQMPATALTWQQVFTQAPAPYGPTQTGLAMGDTPKPIATYEAHIVGNRVGDQYIAGLVFLAQHSLQSGQGFINFIDYATGELRVGGTMGSATTGARVKVNDPLGRFGRAWSPDVRFTMDEDNPTVRSETGYPMCVPRVAPGAVGAAETDPLCPRANRPQDGTSPSGFAMILTMPAVGSVAPGGPDPRLMAPFEVGDFVTYSGIIVPGDPTLVAAFQMIGNVGLFTAPGDSLAYVATDVLLLGVGGQTAVGAAEATIRTRFEGFTTDPTRRILLYGIDVDPCTGRETARDWGSIGVDPGPPNGAVMGRWRFRPPCDPTKPLSDKNCAAPPAGTFLPATREMQAAIESAPGSGVPAAPVVTKNDLLAGQYIAPIFEFLFPENAGAGTPIVPNNFEGMPFLALGSGPLDGTGPVIGQLSPWPLGAATPPTPPVCAAPTGPVANAGANQTVASGANVALRGSGTDPSGLPITGFAWTQTGGTPVVLSGATTATASFRAPSVAFGQPQALLTFALVVTNSAGVKSAPAATTVTVNPVASDTVAISLVEYRTGKQRLTVDATSTAVGRSPAPVLTMQMLDSAGKALGAPQVMPFVGGAVGFEVVLVGAPQPASIRVTSSYGGTATSGITRLRN